MTSSIVPGRSRSASGAAASANPSSSEVWATCQSAIGSGGSILPRGTRGAPEHLRCGSAPSLQRMQSSTFAAISSILVESFDVDATVVTAETALAELGLDSLALMEFVFAVEDRFDVRIPEDRLDPRQAGVTLAQLATLIDEAVAPKASGDVVG